MEEGGVKGWSCELEWHTHIHTYMLVYINRYSVKTGGTVTSGSYKVHLSAGRKHDQWQLFKKKKKKKIFAAFFLSR